MEKVIRFVFFWYLRVKSLSLVFDFMILIIVIEGIYVMLKKIGFSLVLKCDCRNDI